MINAFIVFDLQQFFRFDILPIHSILTRREETKEDPLLHSTLRYTNGTSTRRYYKMKDVNLFGKKNEKKTRNYKKAKRENFYESLANGYFFSTNLN